MAEAGRTGPAAASGAGGEDREDQGPLLGFSARAQVTRGTPGRETRTRCGLRKQVGTWVSPEVRVCPAMAGGRPEPRLTLEPPGGEHLAGRGGWLERKQRMSPAGAGVENLPHVLWKSQGKWGPSLRLQGSRASSRPQEEGREGACRSLHWGQRTPEEEWEDVGGWEGGDSRRGLPSATRGRGGEQPGNLDLASVGEDIHTSRGR